MPYTPTASYNYTPMSLQDIMGQSAGYPNQWQELTRFGMQSGLDLANRAMENRNAQIAAELAYKQQEANRAYAITQAQQAAALDEIRKQREAALRQEAYSRSLSNPMVAGAVQQNVANAFSSPWAQELMAQKAWNDQSNALAEKFRAQNTGFGAGTFNPIPFGVNRFSYTVTNPTPVKK